MSRWHQELDVSSCPAEVDFFLTPPQESKRYWWILSFRIYNVKKKFYNLRGCLRIVLLGFASNLSMTTVLL